MGPEMLRNQEPAADMLTVADFSAIADRFYKGLHYDDELYPAYVAYKAAYTKYVSGELAPPNDTRDIDEWLFHIAAAATLPSQKQRDAMLMRFAVAEPNTEGGLHG